MKFCERSDKFKYTWIQVAQAFWHRYPNPFSSHVVTEDIVERKMLANGNLYTKRLLTKKVRIPCFGQKLVRNEPVIEESIVDPSRRSIVTYTRNIGAKAAAVIEEKCIYESSNASPTETAVIRQAWVTSKFYFSRAIEAYVVRKSRKAINRTCMGLSHVLSTMFPATAAQENKTLHLLDNTEKLCEKAKKATEIAKSKAYLLASCNTNKQQKIA